MPVGKLENSCDPNDTFDPESVIKKIDEKLLKRIISGSLQKNSNGFCRLPSQILP